MGPLPSLSTHTHFSMLFYASFPDIEHCGGDDSSAKKVTVGMDPHHTVNTLVDIKLPIVAFMISSCLTTNPVDLHQPPSAMI